MSRKGALVDTLYSVHLQAHTIPFVLVSPPPLEDYSVTYCGEKERWDWAYEDAELQWVQHRSQSLFQLWSGQELECCYSSVLKQILGSPLSILCPYQPAIALGAAPVCDAQLWSWIWMWGPTERVNKGSQPPSCLAIDRRRRRAPSWGEGWVQCAVHCSQMSMMSAVLTFGLEDIPFSLWGTMQEGNAGAGWGWRRQAWWRRGWRRRGKRLSYFRWQSRRGLGLKIQEEWERENHLPYGLPNFLPHRDMFCSHS